MLFVDTMVRWIALFSLSSETQKVMKTGGKLLQQGIQYNQGGITELVITHNNGDYLVSVIERGPTTSSTEHLDKV